MVQDFGLKATQTQVAKYLRNLTVNVGILGKEILMVRTDSIAKSEKTHIVKDGHNVSIIRLKEVSNVIKFQVNAHAIHPMQVLLDITESLVYKKINQLHNIGVKKLKHVLLIGNLHKITWVQLVKCLDRM